MILGFYDHDKEFEDEESKTARVIRKCTALFNHFITGLDNMSASKRSSGFFINRRRYTN